MTKKVAVLGGGIGGLSAAYDIVSKDDDCEVTIFQMGWRLGGKCASSRNQSAAYRIEEHGIHALFGAYENAFHLVRRVYDDLGLNWEDAFAPQKTFTLFDSGGGEWERWDFSAPVRDGHPGDILMSGQHKAPSLLVLAKRLIKSVWDTVIHHFERYNAVRPTTLGVNPLARLVDGALSRLEEPLTAAEGEAVIRDLTRAFDHFEQLAEQASQLLNAADFRGHGRELAPILRKLRVLAELGIAGGIGALRIAIRHTPLSQLDELDALEWLNANAIGGRLSEMAAKAAPLRMIYESSFAFEDGDPERPNYAARAMIRQLMWLLFDYRGHIAYKMKRGTAETLFTPLYEALKKRGVRFEFFHRVDEIVLTGDEKNVAAVRFAVQSHAKNAPYDPFILGDCWPDKPKYDLLANGDILRDSEELEGGGYDLEAERSNAPVWDRREIKWTGAGGGGDWSFDRVVLAVPVGASKQACAALVNSMSAGRTWGQMYEHIKTTPTQAFQLWFDRSADELGWKADDSALVGCYELPFSNWADMSDVLTVEKWPPEAAKNVAYLCGPLIETNDLKNYDPNRWRETVRDTAERWTEKHAKCLWPNFFTNGKADWDRLVVVDESGGKGRFRAQFFQANLNASARYVLSRKGTQKYRIAPDKSGFSNLFLAGDWTRNGLDIGCVEATVMSGRLAARAVLGLTKSELPIYGEVD